MSIHYQFPIVKNISQFLPIIEKYPEFVVKEKDGGYTVITYNWQNGKDTFPPISNQSDGALLRECRGIKFDTATGDVIARPMHKFFNKGERDDLHPDWSMEHRVLEKLDGSMIHPLRMSDGSLRWSSKAGVTDTSMQAEEFIIKHRRTMRYEDFADLMLDSGYTPCFEWCSRQQRIVLDYPDDQLVLLNIRHNEIGNYATRNELQYFANHFNLRLVEEVPFDLFLSLANREDEEGVVFVFADGHMVKEKTEWYVRHHRAKSLIDNERDVVKVILSHGVDDLLPLMANAETKVRLEKFAHSVNTNIRHYAYSLVEAVLENRKNGVDKKTFALEIAPQRNKAHSGGVFSLWEVPDKQLSSVAHSWTVDLVLKNLSTSKGYEERIVRNGIITQRWK